MKHLTTLICTQKGEGKAHACVTAWLRKPSAVTQSVCAMQTKNLRKAKTARTLVARSESRIIQGRNEYVYLITNLFS